MISPVTLSRAIEIPTAKRSSVNKGTWGGRLMELHQIRYFVALCETLNFARAAEQCNVSQPSLTRAVQKLEQELGGSLIHRERRNTRLTALGELVRPMLKKAVVHSGRVKGAAEQNLSGRAKV